ncbi:putative ribonuclease H protein, partial [Trifolium medium]|nr:putative ribonuclease H protein [Trifolium medium]
MLRNQEVDWVEEEDQLKNMVNDFYKDLFREDNNAMVWRDTDVSFAIITEEEKDQLKAILSNNEVKEALFSMSAWKAPGPDGFPVGFYQKDWNVIAESVCEFARTMWAYPEKIEDVNFTDICLIPKVNKPEFVNQFHPISLCNVSYKILTKVVVNRLKPIISKVVSPFQTGFVPGRNISENIIIAQEMLHSMAKMRSRIGFFAIKVDLTKAYDRLRWPFIEKVLIEVGIPNEMHQFIMSCIRSVKTNVLWNGSMSSYFNPECGIRQGDPMSPYIFVLCMDKLSHLITEEIDTRHWTPMRAGRNSPHISHLMFADDLLLFGQATEATMASVTRALENFCTMSGQRVN